MKFSFENLPKSVEEMIKLEEYGLETPFATAALTVLSLDVYSSNKDEGIKMLNTLKGPKELSTYEISFLKDRFASKDYVPRSYYMGATPENNYEGLKPYVLDVLENPYSYNEDGYATLYITSGGADSPRSIKLRKKDDKWYLWEQMLLADIRKPASEDEWV